MEILIVLWLLFAGACAVIAANKGRSTLGWFVLGFLFGPFALLVVAVLSRNEHAQVRRGLQSGDLRTCPFCAEPVRVEATRCRYCNSDLPPPPKYDVWGRAKA